MARYRIPERSYINSSIVEAGEIIEYNGDFPGSEWELIEVPKPEPKEQPSNPHGPKGQRR